MSLCLKQYMIVSDVEHLKDINIVDVCKSYKTIDKFAVILHDKDIGTRPHWHIYVNFGKSSVSSELVAKWFGIPENFVEKIKGRRVDAIKYLTHLNAPNKYQYPISEVIANFNVQLEIDSFEYIGNYDKYTYAEQLAKCNLIIDVVERTRVFNLIEKDYKRHCKTSSLETERDLKVIFVTGGSGFGKTYYLKKFFESLDYDICMSSSSNDVFQDYLGQRSIILDDLRDSVFKFLDLLKILDNNTKSSVYSRFVNKPVDCKMIGITSNVDLCKWYKGEDFDVKDEELWQLYRRISCYVVVNEFDILVYPKGLDKKGKPVGEPKRYVNEVPKLKLEDKVNVDFGAIFDNIANPFEYDMDENRQLRIKADCLPF